MSGDHTLSGHRHEGALGAVYEARTPEEVAQLYDGWASTYDAEMAKAGYRHPSICLALLARHVPAGSAPILDAGAGTGLVGEWLGIIGYPEVEALDISKGMLEVAARKNVYTQLHQAALGTPLPFADCHFAAIVSAGVFTTGHVGPEGLDELLRICRPGGVMVLTVKMAVWDSGFAARVDEMAKAGQVTVAEQTAPYVSMPGETGTVPSLALVLRRNS
jgi:predicted TPR repeat methyltransferase